MTYLDELFVELLKKMLCGCKKIFNLVVDGMSAHKKAVVKTYVAKTDGEITRHFLLGYALNLSPDRWHDFMPDTGGVTKSSLKKGEKSQERTDQQLQAVGNNPELEYSFFK